MKSVCFVATTPFAVNAFLLKHLEALSDRFQVSLCVNVAEYKLSEKLDKRVTVINVPFARKISLFRDVKAQWHLVRTFRTHSFDAVHSITPKAGLLTMFAAFLSRVPRRYHTFTGQVWATRKGLSRVFLKLMDCVIAVFATRVFSDSPSQSRFLESQGVVKRGSISVLGKGSISGVDGARFRPDPIARRDLRSKLSIGEQVCVFLFVGRVVTDKGVSDLIRAFSKLSDCKELELWVVGPDEEGLKDKFEHCLAEQERRIRWMGATFEPEYYMAAADVFVLPSYREGFGLVIAEAASCGVPAIAYRIDGVVDAIKEGVTGLLVDVGNVEELSVAMKAMLASPELRREYGLKALDRVRREFSQVEITSAWISFYENEMKDQIAAV